MPDKKTAVRTNATTLIGGHTGGGKTSLLATFAEHVYRTTGGITRIYVTDGGAGVARMEALVRKGIVQIFKLRSRVSVSEGSRDLAFETVARAAQGWWPERIKVLSGEVAAGAKMVPPVLQVLKMKCAKGHTVAEEQLESKLRPMKCPECGVLTSKRQGTIERSTMVTPGFEKVKAVAYDGLTSACEWGMGDMADRSARGEITKNERDSVGIVNSGEMRFGGNVRTHYGHVQNMAYKWVHMSNAIPNLAFPPVWTCLLTKAANEEGGEGSDLPIWGPKIAGSAKTSVVAQWFGNYIGALRVAGEKGRLEHRLYLSPVEERGAMHTFKCRVNESLIPLFISDHNGEEIRKFLEEFEGEGEFSGFNIGVFYRIVEAAIQRISASVSEEFADLPDVGEDDVLTVGGGIKFEAEDAVNLEEEGGEEAAAEVGGAGWEYVEEAPKAAAPKAPSTGSPRPTPSKPTAPKPSVKGPSPAAPKPSASPRPAPTPQKPSGAPVQKKPAPTTSGMRMVAPPPGKPPGKPPASAPVPPGKKS